MKQISPQKKVFKFFKIIFEHRFHPSLFSRQQFTQLANSQEKLEKLKNVLLKEVNKCDLKAPSSDFQQQLKAFQQIIAYLRQQGYCQSANIVEDFVNQAPNYTGILDKQGNIKTDNLAKVQRFAELFDREHWTLRRF